MVQEKLEHFIDNIAIPPSLIHSIMQASVHIMPRSGTPCQAGLDSGIDVMLPEVLTLNRRAEYRER